MTPTLKDYPLQLTATVQDRAGSPVFSRALLLEHPAALCLLETTLSKISKGRFPVPRQPAGTPYLTWSLDTDFSLSRAILYPSLRDLCRALSCTPQAWYKSPVFSVPPGQALPEGTPYRALRKQWVASGRDIAAALASAGQPIPEDLL